MAGKTEDKALLGPTVVDFHEVERSEPTIADAIVPNVPVTQLPGETTQTSLDRLLPAEPRQPTYSASRTYGFPDLAATATQPGATWISPLLPGNSGVPTLLIRGSQEARFVPARGIVRSALNRFCGLDLSQPSPRSALIVAHPDDEAVGAGARLHDLADVTVVHVTDGAPADDAYARRKGFRNREAYALSRQEELSSAFSLIGVPSARLRCLGVTDGQASEQLEELTYRIVDLLDEQRPEVVVTHPYEGGHTDHDATAFAVHLACGLLRRDGVQAPLILELTSYHLYRGVRRFGEFLPARGIEERSLELDPTMQELKQRMYDCFTSQRECLSCFPRDREKFRAAPRYVFTAPPHPGTLLYERVSQAFSGARWRENARAALERLRGHRQYVSGWAA